MMDFSKSKNMSWKCGKAVPGREQVCIRTQAGRSVTGDLLGRAKLSWLDESPSELIH